MYEYWLACRPPMPGCMPDGAVVAEDWSAEGGKRRGYGWLFLGMVGYRDQLTFEQIYDYELTPADPKEGLTYALWRTKVAWDVWQEYLEVYQANPKRIRRFAEGNDVTAALVIRFKDMSEADQAELQTVLERTLERPTKAAQVTSHIRRA